MFRVANFAQHTLTLSYAMRTQGNLAERQIEIASGKRAQRYSSISSQASELVNVERAVSRTTQFSRHIDQALTRLGIRSEERRAGQECVRTCNARESPYLKKKK